MTEITITYSAEDRALRIQMPDGNGYTVTSKCFQAKDEEEAAEFMKAFAKSYDGLGDYFDDIVARHSEASLAEFDPLPEAQASNAS